MPNSSVSQEEHVVAAARKVMAKTFDELDKQDASTFAQQLFGACMFVNGYLYALTTSNQISLDVWRQLQAEKEQMSVAAEKS